ncbi:hypothetical protein [Maribacter halichondriae]|uniref:hypothetical protein n=1 Tax=Maribacter halichondriae TaxID=2980554 RepID=UPI0023584F54|nr:hypothetical protein [Maribacter sp. Hal144]
MAISKQKIALFFRLSISATVFGALFKFVSWPLIMLGVTGMVIFHTIQFFQNQHRSALDYARQLLIVSFSCNYVFNLFSLPYVHILILITKLALIAFLILYIKKIMVSFQDITQNNSLLLTNLGRENLSHILADLATVYIVIASLFKMLHWEFGIINANVLLVIGLFSALISIVASPKNVAS